MCDFDVYESVGYEAPCAFKGINTRIYYANPDWITTEGKVDLDAATTLEEGVVNATDFVFEAGKFWLHIDVTPDKGDLISGSEGEKGNLGVINGVSLMAPASNKLLGFINGHLNKPMVYLVKEGNGRVRQIGSKARPALLNSFQASTGKAAGDNNGVEFSMEATGLIAPVYTGAIQIA